MRKLNTIPSSNVKSIWWSSGTQTLRVMFGNGTYLYEPVLEDFVDKLEAETTSLTNCLKEITQHPETYRCQKVS